MNWNDILIILSIVMGISGIIILVDTIRESFSANIWPLFLFPLGLFFIAVEYFFLPSKGDILFAGQELLKSDTISIRQVHIPAHAGPEIREIANLKIKYPAAMEEDETGKIILKYDRRMQFIFPPGEIDDGRYDYAKDQFKRFSNNISFRLYSPGFDIEPEKEIQKVKGDTSDFQEIWLARPKSAGRHVALLEVSNLLLKKNVLSLHHSNEIFVNGKSDSTINAGNGIIELPIKVYTIWGTSPLTFEITKYTIQIVGFVLLLPFVVKLIEKFFKPRILNTPKRKPIKKKNKSQPGFKRSTKA